MRLLRPRLREPVSAAVGGTVITVIVGISQGWVPAVVLAVATVVFTVGLYAWGGKDTDVGAVIGRRADERQTNLRMKVNALQGQILTVAAALVFLVAVIGKATAWPKASIWPFEIPVLLAGLSGLLGWTIYRDRGQGDDAPAGLRIRDPRLRNHARPGAEWTTTQIACTGSPVLFRYSCGVEESKAIESPGPSS
jgi:hypothetical protein